MELRQLRYFLAVAEDLHFTRAAARMHVAQPALSAQIRSLEREVGGPLLDRTTRNVRLTDVGEALLPDAREIVRAADEALAGARAIARRRANTLAVGCLGAAPGDLLRTVLEQMASTRPEARVDFHTFDFAQLWTTFAEGHTDVAFAYLPPGEAELDAIDVLPLWDEPRVVVLASTHPLADRTELFPSDLAGETFISHSDAVPQRWRDFWLLADELGDDRPAVHDVVADSPDEWLHLIACGDGIDTCPAFVGRYYGWPTVRYVPLVGASPATLALLRKRHDHSALVDLFVTTAVEAAAVHEHG